MSSLGAESKAKNLLSACVKKKRERKTLMNLNFTLYYMLTFWFYMEFQMSVRIHTEASRRAGSDMETLN